MIDPLVLVHGGAGDVPAISKERHRQGCLSAARRGGAVLEGGGTAVEAACAAVEILEDDEVFNAGTGCALDRNGKVSLDAAVMCGHTLRAGSVASLSAFKNPIRIAAKLLSEHTVMLAGRQACAWAVDQGFENLEDQRLVVPRSHAAWEYAMANGGASNWAGGTVGAVVRDAKGHLAAATSTGGTMGKDPGRVGDSPLIGAGTYANQDCAVSATGDGEAFIRAAFAASMAFGIHYGQDPAKLLRESLQRIERDFQGLGGAILVTPDSGPLAFMTTKGMAHAWWTLSEDGVDD